MDKEDIANYLRKAITAGRFKPGRRIVESSLSRQMKVSRNKIRDAFREVEKEGIIELIPHRGAIVRIISQEDLAQCYDIMGALEGLSMRIATPIITEKQIEELQEKMLGAEKSLNDYKKFALKNQELHMYMTRLGRNSRIISFLESIHKQSFQMRIYTFVSKNQLIETKKEHSDIVQAVKMREPELVERLIREHYQNRKIHILKFINNTL